MLRYPTCLAAIAPLLLLGAAIGVTRFVASGIRALVLGVVVVAGLAGAGANVIDDRTQAPRCE